MSTTVSFQQYDNEKDIAPTSSIQFALDTSKCLTLPSLMEGLNKGVPPEVLLYIFIETRRVPILKKLVMQKPLNKLETMCLKHIDKYGNTKSLTIKQSKKFMVGLGKIILLVIDLIDTKKEIIAEKNRLFRLVIAISNTYEDPVEAKKRRDELGQLMLILDNYIDDLVRILDSHNFLKT